MMKRPAAVMKRPACHKRPAANVASSRVSESEVADTAPDWLVEPDPTAQLYVFLVTAAKLVNGRRSASLTRSKDRKGNIADLAKGCGQV